MSDFEERAFQKIEEFAEKSLDKVIDKTIDYANDLVDAAINAARDGVENLFTGKRDLDEWTQIVGEAIDEVRNKIQSDNPTWNFVGGKVHFSMSPKKVKKVVVSFDLYYQDKDEKWKKISASSDMYASIYTDDALEDIKSNGTVSFEVE